MESHESPPWIATPLEAVLGLLLPSRGERLDGARHGPWVRSLPGGRRLSEVEYERGLRHGRATRWYLDGRKRYVGHYVRGKKTGEWFYFRRDGKLDGARTGQYENGLRFAALKGFNDWNA